MEQTPTSVANCVPQELIDHTFTFIDPELKGFLRSCGLVARSWCHASRRIAFQRIRCDVRRLHRFFNVTDSPSQTVRQHIKELLIVHGAYPTRQLLFIEDLRIALARFSYIHSLELDHVALTYRNDDCGGSIIAQRNLRALNLRSMRFCTTDERPCVPLFTNLLRLFHEIGTLALYDLDMRGKTALEIEPSFDPK